MYACMYTLYVYVYTYVYIYIERERDRERDMYICIECVYIYIYREREREGASDVGRHVGPRALRAVPLEVRGARDAVGRFG